MSHTLVLNSDAMPVGVLPLSALQWQDAIKAVYLGSVSVLHDYDNWNITSPSCAMRVPSVVMARTYINVRRFVGFSKEMISLRDGYRCQYCGGGFGEERLTMDHVLPKSHGGKLTFSNTVAACSPCNSARGNDVRIKPRTPPYRPTYHELIAKRRHYPVTVPHEAWLHYIGWPEELVTIVQPKGEPGYVRHDEPQLELRDSLLLQARG
jgi:5-methylcytosine-specific restriction endonuclease McrA